MSLKDENMRYLIMCVACSVVLIVIFVIFQQFSLLFSLALIYWFVMVFYCAVPLFRAGMKEIREARARGEEASWKKNPHIKEALIIVIPVLLPLIEFLRGRGQPPGKTGIPVVDIIITIVLSIPLALVLSFEVAFTIGLIRRFHNLNDPFKEYLENLTDEEHGLKHRSSNRDDR